MSNETPGPGKLPGDESGAAARRPDLTPEERAAYQARADAIGKRLEAAKSHSETLPKPAKAGKANIDGSAMGKALRVSTELIGGIIVGSGIGWLLDTAFGTTPLLFIVFFLLGSAAGMLNVIRSSAPSAKASAKGPPPAAAKDDDEDA